MSQSDTPDLTDSQRAALEHLPNPTTEIADALGITNDAARKRLKRVTHAKCSEDGEWYWDGPQSLSELFENSGGPDLESVSPESEPDETDLTNREAYILNKLQQGSEFKELVDDLGARERIVSQHLRELKRNGWEIYHDDTADHYALADDGHTIRSSEHKGTRTRKANKWWEQTHNELVRRYKALSEPSVDRQRTPGSEDWVVHMTDLHAGDKVRGYEGSVIHETEELPGIIDYITEESLRCAEKHDADYDAAYAIWTGDFVTNEGIFEGQYENLDAWLDEQSDILHDPLLRQIKALSERFPTVHVVCQAGNHGDIRANGSSKQANADLLVYKSIRNTVAALQEHAGLLENVEFKIGRAGSVTPVWLRGGEIHGQLRHGQDRSPQADTSARKKEWLSTILDSMNAGAAFDVAWMGHHHVSGMLPWNGPPVFISGSPKPGGEYPRKLGELTGPNRTSFAHAHGVSDAGVTGVYPIDERHFDG